jgi:AGCS family alanine or glycine:cation symporter
MYRYIVILCILVIANNSYAIENMDNNANIIISFLSFIIEPLVNFLAFIFLGSSYEIFGEVRRITIFHMPILVLWLLAGGIFFTLKLRFINIRLFKHGLAVVRGKYDDHKTEQPGKISHAEALFAAVSATVGLGNIAGVAIAISIGGPGAVIWMMLAAFFGMSTKFAEVTLGQKYRKFDKDGHLLAGAFYYLEDGLAVKGYKKLGLILAKLAAIFCITGAIGAGIMFQANQSVAIVVANFAMPDSGKIVIVLLLALSIGFVLLGGIVRIAHIAAKIVPVMAISYIICCIIILFINSANILPAIKLMFISAFHSNALYGGVIGAIIQGVKRSAFSNEAGIGSAVIAHAAAKTKEPVREGSVAILEPFIDTIIICFMTGVIITVTGVYEDSSIKDGVLLTKAAFSTVSPLFPILLTFIVFLFAFSTMLTYSYYGQQAWIYLTKKNNYKTCHIIFIIAVIIGGLLNLGVVIDFADILFLVMAVPNLIGLYILSGDIKLMTDEYIKKLKANKF